MTSFKSIYNVIIKDQFKTSIKAKTNACTHIYLSSIYRRTLLLIDVDFNKVYYLSKLIINEELGLLIIIVCITNIAIGAKNTIYPEIILENTLGVF